MKLTGSKMQTQIARQAAEARSAAAIHHYEARTALGRGDYSAAATACHRAHQQKLVAEALDEAAKR